MGLLPEELEELGLDPNAVSEESNEDESTRRGRRLRSQDSKPFLITVFSCEFD